MAGRGGAFDLESEFGVPAEHLAALDRVTRLAIAAGIDALRDAGIPLVMRYKTTSKGTQLPERWGLPDAMRDDTGVIFGSAFPGYDSFAEIISAYHVDHARREELAMLEGWRAHSANGHSVLGQEMDRRIDELHATLEKQPYVFDRRFLLRVLSMGHSQFAELIGARGPNTQINAACATTAQGVSLAEDWIRAERCRRVIVISADDVTSDNMIGWFGAGFLASGAAATDERVEEAAIPFDRRRHGLIMGMGAAALVVESAEAARERGIQPICEVLSAVTANSAFHGTRLDVQHIGGVMESLVAAAETRSGIARGEVAPKMVFVSHETYTPARGGSASAEIHALRRVFGEGADQIVIANTKGMTGHAMATGIEDVLAVKTLETGLVPPVANFKEVDPELGVLNLSKGGAYPIQYALASGRRLRFTDQHDSVAPGTDERRCPSQTECPRLRLSHCRPECLERVAKPDGRPASCGSGSGSPDSARSRSGIGRAHRSDRCRRSCVANADCDADTTAGPTASGCRPSGVCCKAPSASGRSRCCDYAGGTSDTRQERQVQRRDSSHGTRPSGAKADGFRIAENR